MSRACGKINSWVIIGLPSVRSVRYCARAVLCFGGAEPALPVPFPRAEESGVEGSVPKGVQSANL